MRIDEVFEQTHKLPTVPRVVQELISSFGQEDINVSEIADRIALDQVITAKLLRLANSAHFGASRKIGSAHEAIIVLGFNTVRTLVVASGVTGAFVATPGFDRQQFWRKGLHVALAARGIAQRSRDNREIAFTCGLLHSIGELLIHVVEPELAAKIDRSVATGSDRIKLESSNLGFTYLELGAELARRWNFPETIQQAIAEQQDAAPSSRLSALLQLALAATAAEGGDAPVWPTAALELLQLPAAELDALLPTLELHDPELEEMLL
ncbi:HDOD domain-containing protein [Chitinolyticbacter meiyuanensis]|uniref:HDOD domain-containing protein n=1 Tax=Chitinolyticbacter meiyuanensis TaxID=682798 RepID=UPI0011E5FD7E|nr:HDOD domain-containing protein [Chitinolyticbacter meiyuanensis]